MKRQIKIIMNILTLLLAGACLVSCAPREDDSLIPPSGSAVMTATVIKMDEKIEVNATEPDYTTGVYWVITSKETTYIDSDGKKIGRSDLKAGDTVKIYYSGQVMMSYPPQIVAITVKRTRAA